MYRTSPDPERLFAWVALMHAQAAVAEAMDADLQREAGLPLSWVEVMHRLSRAPADGVRMQDLARTVLLSKSGLTRLADRMEQAGLLRRAACADDRRGTYAALTEKGRRALQRAVPAFHRSVHRHFGRYLADPDIRALDRVLWKLLVGHGHAEWCSEAAGTQPRFAYGRAHRAPAGAV